MLRCATDRMSGWRMVAASVLALATALSANAQEGRSAGALTYGPHPVGFRLQPVRDHSRHLGPPLDFEGRPGPGVTAWPVHAAIWYPAASLGGARLQHGDYWRFAASRETLAEPTSQDAARVVTEVRDLARVAFQRDIDEAEANQVLSATGRAVRDASPAAGRFPLIVGSLGDTSTAWTLAEFLASHGYVVVSAPAIGPTVTAQAARPALALESQARTIEFLYALVRDLPYVDPTRQGLIGVNFDGASALLVQSRGMQARAVVTIDGVEGKPHGPAILASSPWFDVVRIRVPYLTVQWDEPTLGPLDYTVFDRLRYADRRSVVIRGLGHLDLVANLLPWPQIDAETREGYALLYDSIRAFLDAQVRGVATAPPQAPPDRFADDRRAAALPPAPTPEELEQVIWQERDVDRGIAIIRAARAANPALEVVDRRTLSLYAFRYQQLGQARAAGALRALAEELTPPQPR